MKKIAKFLLVFLFLSGIFLRPASIVLAQNNDGNSISESGASTTFSSAGYEGSLNSCGVTSGSKFVACFVWLFYYMVLYPSSKFAEITANLLDFFIAYSLDSNSYGSGNGEEFVSKGWSIIRDIANVSFIFILLYIAIMHILQSGSSNTKKLLVSVIIAALLINFSMFFSKVIIDAGNILARAFYSNIEITNPSSNQAEGEGKEITQAIVTHISPQKLLDSNLFKSQSNAQQGEALNKIPNGYAFFILGIVAFVNITLGLIFLSTFLLFAARTIGLWFMMIFSPIAFASIAIPGAGGFLGQFGWKSWRDTTLKLSFMAPIFLFFLFLVVMFLQIITNMDNGLGTQTDTQLLMNVLIPFVVVIVILKQAKKVAVDMSGEFGKALTGAVGTLAKGALALTGVGMAASLGIAAAVGRQTVGKAATRELASGVNQRNVAKFNRLAKAAEARGQTAVAQDYRQRSMEAAKKVSRLKARSEGSYDVRRSEFLQKQVFGSKLGKLAGTGLQTAGSEAFGGAKLNLDIGKGKDTSRAKQEEARKKKALEEAKLYETGGQEEQNLALVGYAARKGINARDEVLEHLDKYTAQISNDASLTDQERREYFREIRQMRVRATTARTDAQMQQLITGFQRTDALGNGVRDAEGNPIMERGTDTMAKTFATEVKNAFADVVEAREQNNSVVNFYGLNPRPDTKPHYSSVVADKIRKGDKPAGKKTMDEFFREWQEDQGENNNNNPNPPNPNPNPNPPNNP